MNQGIGPYSVEPSKNGYWFRVWFKHETREIQVASYRVRWEADDHARSMNDWYAKLSPQQRKDLAVGFD